MSHVRTATAPQAALLLDPELGPLLARLSERPVGAAELARSVNRPLSSVHAVLQRLVREGLVEQVSVRTRAGRPVREYELPMPWRIPFAVTPASTFRELLGVAFRPAYPRTWIPWRALCPE
ncbi:helix-turn-helix domain-containing protein [Deinococcus malanensis]|uniref:helix-turn-helix domain-containing protein n=1 Tax=Deinococcus malanensis TaxID=1706855 RepID=UPI003637D48D